MNPKRSNHPRLLFLLLISLTLAVAPAPFVFIDYLESPIRTNQSEINSILGVWALLVLFWFVYQVWPLSHSLGRPNPLKTAAVTVIYFSVALYSALFFYLNMFGS